MYDEPFSITHPEIAAEWSKKNAPLTPADFTAGAHERVWWICKYGHEWQTKINNRCINNTGCPYCTSRQIKKGFNDFATLYPELLKEWSDHIKGQNKYQAHDSDEYRDRGKPARQYPV